jgi:hypothetical protein
MTLNVKSPKTLRNLAAQEKSHFANPSGPDWIGGWWILPAAIVGLIFWLGVLLSVVKIIGY